MQDTGRMFNRERQLHVGTSASTEEALPTRIEPGCPNQNHHRGRLTPSHIDTDLSHDAGGISVPGVTAPNAGLTACQAKTSTQVWMQNVAQLSIPPSSLGSMQFANGVAVTYLNRTRAVPRVGV